MLTGSKRPKAVIDTNVLISGLNFAGKPGEVMELFMKGKIEIYLSPFILSELEIVLKKRFEWEDEQIARILSLIKMKAIVIDPALRLSIIKDKNADNRILECALAGKVDYIISGDKRHILPLKEYSGIRILTPDEFLRLWEY